MVRPGFQLSVRRGSYDRGRVNVGSGGAPWAARIARLLGVGASCALLVIALAGCASGGPDRDGAPANGASATTSSGGSVGATPSAGVTASAGVTTTGSSNQSALLQFDLELQGAVPFADRYSVDLSINGTPYAYGFCGFSLETRCSSTVYSWSLPSVPVGASLTWHLTWVGNSTRQVAQAQDITHSKGTIVKVRCAYLPPASNTTPTCSREL